MIKILDGSTKGTEPKRSLDEELLWVARNKTRSEGAEAAVSIAKLLREGANPMAVDENGCSALFFAAGSKIPDCVDLLLHRSDVFQKGAGGQSALHRAAAAGHLGVLQAVGAACASQAFKSNRVGWADERDGHGETALIEAARVSAPCAAQMLRFGADPMARNSSGKSALVEAVAYEQAEVVELLLPVSDLGQTDKHGRGVAFWAATRPALLGPVLRAGAPCGPDERGETPLMEAAGDGVADSVRLLLAKSDPWAVDKAGRSALLRAVCSEGRESLACVELIASALEAKADPIALHGELSIGYGAAVARRGAGECASWLGGRVAAVRESMQIDGALTIKARADMEPCALPGKRRSL